MSLPPTLTLSSEIAPLLANEDAIAGLAAARARLAELGVDEQQLEGPISDLLMLAQLRAADHEEARKTQERLDDRLRSFSPRRASSVTDLCALRRCATSPNESERSRCCATVGKRLGGEL
jgi:hypothetical protein